VGINPALRDDEVRKINQGLPEGAEVLSADIRHSGLASNSFGAIFSVAVFEHLLDLGDCLDEMRRLVEPGGLVYAAFGPIWSSSLGHHVFADVDGVELRHWDPRLNPIEDHAHLLLAQDELYDEVAGLRGEAIAEAAIEWIYRSQNINRLFFEDYVRAFEHSGFAVLRLSPEREHVPQGRLAQLRQAYPGYMAFDVRNAVIVLRKTPDDLEA
jgi:SAM-dependent methyltransferase